MCNILFKDYESNVHDLSNSIGGQTLTFRRLTCMLLEVYKCMNKVNAPCLHNLFKTNTTTYQLRTSKLEQTLRRTTRYVLGTFSYIGSHWCNSVLNDHSDIAHVDFNEFKASLNTRSGYFSICDTPPLMTSSAVSVLSVGVCRVLDIPIDILLHVYMYFSILFFYFFNSILFYYVYLVIALYIFAPYTCSRILAFWLMLCVFHTT